MNKLIEEHAIGKGIEMEIAECSALAVDGAVVVDTNESIDERVVGRTDLKDAQRSP